MVNFIKGSGTFISKYFLQILLMCLVLCLITIYLVVFDVNIHERQTRLAKVVTVEAFDNPFADSVLFDSEKHSVVAFGETCKEDPYRCEEMCNSLLDTETCNMISSCVWAHSKNNDNEIDNGQCVAGSDLGATFNADKYIKTIFNNRELNI